MTSSNTPMGLDPRTDDCTCHACFPEARYDDLDRATIDTVLRHGWQVLLVDAGGCACCAADTDPGGSDGPPFAYTVGLGHRAGHPELLMSGLDPDLMHRVLNDLAQRVVDGKRCAAGDVVEGALGGVPVALAQVTPAGLTEAVTWSGWFHRRPPEALMIVWPSTSGVFAWQPGAPESIDELQRPSWREPIAPVGALATDPPWPFPVEPDIMAFSCEHVVELGRSVLLVARQDSDLQTEDWTIHCGSAHHESQLALTHLAHLVRSAPSLRDLADLPLGWVAERPDVDTPWTARPIRGDEQKSA